MGGGRWQGAGEAHVIATYRAVVEAGVVQLNRASCTNITIDTCACTHLLDVALWYRRVSYEWMRIGTVQYPRREVCRGIAAVECNDRRIGLPTGVRIPFAEVGCEGAEVVGHHTELIVVRERRLLYIYIYI